MSDNGFKEPSGYSTYSILPEVPIIIGLDTPHTEGTHILYDSRIHNPIRKEQVEAVIAKGVIFPVILYRDSENRLLVVDGRQRIRWAREANKFFAENGDDIQIKVPYRMHSGNLTEALSSMIMVNEIREDDTIIAKAQKANTMASNGMSIVEICLAFGVSDQTVENWLNLANTPEAMKIYSETGSAQLAYAMARNVHRKRARRITVRPKVERINDILKTLSEMPLRSSDFNNPDLHESLRRLAMESKDILDRRKL